MISEKFEVPTQKIYLWYTHMWRAKTLMFVFLIELLPAGVPGLRGGHCMATSDLRR